MILRSLRIALFAAAALSAIAFLYAAIRVVARPQTLSPIESVLLEQASDVARNEPAYREPSDRSVATPMPGFPVAVSMIARALGPGLWEARAVSMIAILLIAVLSLLIVQIETGSWTLAAAAFGFVLMGHGLLVREPGVPRPEQLMVLLIVVGALALRLSDNVWGALQGAVLFAAAFFVDVQALWFVGAAMVSLALENRTRWFAFSLTTMVLIGGGYAAASATLGPWFNFAAFDGPLRSLRFAPAAALKFVGDHLLGKLAVPTLAAVLAFAMPTPPWRGKGGLWTCLGLAALLSGLFTTQSQRFGTHALLPSIVAMSLLGPISIQRVTRHLSAWPGSSRFGGQGVVLAALTLQLIVFLSCLPLERWLPHS